MIPGATYARTTTDKNGYYEMSVPTNTWLRLVTRYGAYSTTTTDFQVSDSNGMLMNLDMIKENYQSIQ